MTNELESHLQELLKEFDSKIKNTETYLTGLKEDRQTIKDMLLKQQGFALQPKPSKKSENGLFTILPEIKLKPMDAIKFVMENKPVKEYWSAPELKEEIEFIQGHGLLLSDATTMIYVVHSSLKSLVKRGDVKKEYIDGNPVFRLIKDEEKDLLIK